MKTAPQIMLSNENYRGLPVVFVNFTFNQTIVERIKKVSQATYIRDKKCWYLQERDFNFQQFKSQLGSGIQLNTEKLALSNGADNLWNSGIAGARKLKNNTKIHPCFANEFQEF